MVDRPGPTQIAEAPALGDGKLATLVRAPGLRPPPPARVNDVDTLTSGLAASPRPLDNFQSLAYFTPELVLILAILLLIGWDLVAKRAREDRRGSWSSASAPSPTRAGMSAYFLMRGRRAAEPVLRPARLRSLLEPVPDPVRARDRRGRRLLAPQGAARRRGERGSRRRAAIRASSSRCSWSWPLGMNLMAESRNLLMIYLSLELVSVICFVMAGFKINDTQVERGRAQVRHLRRRRLGHHALRHELALRPHAVALPRRVRAADRRARRPRSTRCPRSSSSAPSA